MPSAPELPLDPTGTARRAIKRPAVEGPLTEGRSAGHSEGPTGPGTAEVAGTQEDPTHSLETELIEGAARADLDESQLFLGAELYRFLPDGNPLPRGPWLRLLAASRLAHARGSTRLSLSEEAGASGLAQHLLDLGVEGPRAQEVFDLARALLEDPQCAAPVIAAATDAPVPLIIADGHLYPRVMHTLEHRVAGNLERRLLRELDLDATALHRALDDVIASPPEVAGKTLRLSEEQHAAVAAACRQQVTLISGEPGTGKTSIVVSILRTLARLGTPLERIALAAPTGKAADRMRRSIEATLRQLKAPAFEDRELLLRCPESRTLHRLLGYQAHRQRFRHHEHNPLGESVVIVDESSMIDLSMVDRLLAALGANARLILLGDAEQLPSVDAGAVFRDLCTALAPSSPASEEASPIVRLTKSYRMNPKDPAGRHVLTLARAMNAGASRRLFPPKGAEEAPQRIRRRPTVAALRYEGVEHLPIEQREAFLQAYPKRYALPEHRLRQTYPLAEGQFSGADTQTLSELFDTVESRRLLCLTRGRRTGIDALNQRFHEATLRRANLPRTLRFAVGEPILVRRNDYDRQLYNGDQGLVLFTQYPGASAHPSAVFRRGEGFVAFPLEALTQHLELAYAITIHKSQGSEFRDVALMLPDEDLPLLTREMLYTGVTRAKKSVVIVGNPDLLRLGISRRVERSSGLAERLLPG